MITKQDVNQAISRQQQLAKSRPAAKGKGKLRHTHSIDPVLFHNTRMVGKNKWGCEDVWKEQDFIRDCERHHPEIRVHADGCSVHMMQPSGISTPRNRFGKVSQRYIMGETGLVRVI